MYLICEMNENNYMAALDALFVCICTVKHFAIFPSVWNFETIFQFFAHFRDPVQKNVSNCLPLHLNGNRWKKIVIVAILKLTSERSDRCWVYRLILKAAQSKRRENFSSRIVLYMVLT